MAEVHGECSPRFAKVRELLQSGIANGNELGAAICVNLDGKNVVDIWGGYMDAKRTQPWTRDTITPVWSVTKNITNLAALTLIDRKLLDPNETVATYWPEFATNGKENVRVRHILSHTSGLPAWDGPITIEEIYNVPLATEKLAQAAPWWEPGTASGYHLVTQGHLVGELVRRTTGKSLKEFVATEIAGPLDADFYIGAHERDLERIAELLPLSSLPVPNQSDPQSIASRAIQGTPIKAEDAMTKQFRMTELGASNGFGNARSVVRILSTISLGGEVDGVRLISSETIDKIFEEQSHVKDLVLGAPIRFGLGYALRSDSGPRSWIPQGRVCYWSGWGGSIAMMDVDRRMTISYTMNKMMQGVEGALRTDSYLKAIYEAL